MSYVALYRKFRPRTFDQVKGQDHIVRALKNQLANNRIGHAYLFTGTRGTGKTSAAKIFARAVNCLSPVNGEPCNECENCRSVLAGNFVDVVEVDAASNNGVDDIRQIIEEVRYTPVKGKYKVFIIDEAHMITGAAFNAFLKTLEEPPEYAVFILATTEPHKLPVTILSRCQRYDFRRITNEKITGNLEEILRQEGISAEQKALKYIARMGDGSMRDSISLLDKCIAFNLGEDLTYEKTLEVLGTTDTDVFSELFRSVYAGNAAAALGIIDRAAADGKDLTRFASDFIWYIRNMLMVKAAGNDASIFLGLSEENTRQLQNDSAAADDAVLMRYIRIISELINQMRFSSSKQILMEVAVIRLACPRMETDNDSLADRIRHLEAGVMVPVQNRSIPAYAPGGTAGTPVRTAGESVKPKAQEKQAYPGEPDPFDEFFDGLDPAVMEESDIYDDYPDSPVITYEGTAPGDETPVQKMPAGAGNTPIEGPGNITGASVTGNIENIWSSMMELCDSRRIRSLMGKCMVRPVGTESIRVAVQGTIAEKQLREELPYIRELGLRVAGKPVDIQVVRPDSEQMLHTGKDAFPEELLNNINFNIGTEER